MGPRVFWLVFYGYPYSLHYSKSSLSGEREREGERDKIKDLKGTTQEMVVWMEKEDVDPNPLINCRTGVEEFWIKVENNDEISRTLWNMYLLIIMGVTQDVTVDDYPPPAAYMQK
jgi:hypothetical protein